MALRERRGVLRFMLFFIIRRPSFFRGYSSIAGVAFVPKSSLTSSAVFACISATGESLDVLVLSAAHGSRARPWLKAVDFSLLVGACVAFLGGIICTSFISSFLYSI